MKALIIAEPWISKILSGEKTWEMRSKSAKIRGHIALIAKRSGHVVGLAELIDSKPSLETRSAYATAEPLHRIPPEEQERAFAGGWRTPWVLKNAKRLAKPVPYKHPSGAVTWVVLEPEVIALVKAQIK
jgi:hypothetical protein